MKCQVCYKAKATAWWKTKEICQHCWVVYKYGNMEYYLKRMKEDELKKNKKRMQKGGN